MLDFNWNDLRFFLAVARTGKLTEAARQLATDHATVSRHINALEASLEAKLFERSPRGYRLTETGESFLNRAKQMEAVALEAQAEVSESLHAIAGSVRVGAPDGFGSLFLASRLGHFCRENTRLDIQLVAMPRAFSLSKREADIAISLTRPIEGRLTFRKLTDYRLRLYGSKDYLKGAPRLKAVRDLNNHSLIGYIEDLIFTPELDYLPQIAPDLRPAFSSSNLLAQMQATLDGVGLCVLPDFMATKHAALTPVLTGPVSLTRSLWLVMHADMKDLARIRLVADFIAKETHAAKGVFLPG
ncbi:LysR family transcriptional regulator [Aestuariispira insulae]|uniref:DNA-binding transcriptional LysR family regulator n=1 Tax=Aestuariispira insulae TaxID=1461337 RepID=A0A3D9HRS4_9PROT|nr:LysR family transcriptional regulator [Aestuariispira insulae]RED52031.1 DNA-binding transcriptional LysR family regulator [Aestuariispira insulae]